MNEPVVGVAISTYKRPDVFKKTYKEIKKYLPKGAVLVVVSDHDENAPKEADYVFPERGGVARVKNKCLELLEERGATDFFLFDDDTYPKVKDWWKPYVDSEEPHLMYQFREFANNPAKQLTDMLEIYRDSTIVAYSHTRGCMIYANKLVLEKVGGLDPRFGISMFEHTAWTNRIFNAGLTTFRAMDVPDSSKLIYSMDEYQEVSSSIEQHARRTGLANNAKLYRESLKSSEYIDYREVKKSDSAGMNNVIIASYFTSHEDPQRKVNWSADYSAMKPLIDSLQGEKLVLLHDCFDEPDTEQVTHIKVESVLNPYFQRWLSIYRYLKQHPEIDNVFCVDSTDVEVVNNPFRDMEPGKIYSGIEQGVPSQSRWLRQHSTVEPYRTFTARNRQHILNCGVVGGSREDIIDICRGIYTRYFDSGKKITVEMPIYGFLLRTFYAGRVVTAGVTNQFKSFKSDGTERFKHK